MKKIINSLLQSTIIFSIFYSSFLSAQTQAKLIAFNSSSNGVKIAKWDAGSDVFSSLTDTNVFGVVSSSSTYDANTGSFISKVIENLNNSYTNKLLKFDSSNNSIVVTPENNFINGGAEVDMENGLIYNYRFNGTNYVMSVFNPVTTTLTDIGTFNFPAETNFFADATCYDSNSKKYYFLIQQNDTTKIVTVQVGSLPFSVSETNLISTQTIAGNIGLEFSNTSNTIFAQYGSTIAPSTTSVNNLGQLNPVTGELTNLFTANSVSSTIMFNRTFDQESQCLYFISIDLNSSIKNLVKYDTVNLTYQLLPLPSNGTIFEMEADNYVYAQTRYGALNLNENSLNEIKTYPNPTNSLININGDLNIKSIELFDVQGRLLQTQLINDIQSSIDIGEKSNGIYFIKINSDKGSKVEKIIKE